jgi:pimeloyl-ACP methyl ester carboxylesterase
LAGGCCALLGFLVVLGLVGASYEAIAPAGDARRYPAPGQLVDVGGERLHIQCVGAGSPTVVLDAGLGGSSLDWSLVQPELGRTTRVCAYDRAGMGWSDPGPQPRTPSQIADELHTLLTNAGISGPYVLVGHSLAGKNVRLFALQHPEQVAGMVLVDARSEYVDANTSPAEEQTFQQNIAAQASQFRVARSNMLLLSEQQLGIVVLTNIGGVNNAAAMNIPIEGVASILLGHSLSPAVDPPTDLIGPVLPLAPLPILGVWMVGWYLVIRRWRRHGELPLRGMRRFSCYGVPVGIDLCLAASAWLLVPRPLHTPTATISLFAPDIFLSMVLVTSLSLGWALARTRLTFRPPVKAVRPIGTHHAAESAVKQ